MGYLDQSGMVDVVRRCFSTTGMPLIADADTGYGNDTNVRHTIRLLLQAGAKGCFLEDQQWPKRCGHMQGKQVIERQEYIAKIAAAADESKTHDFFLVARTDAIATDGIEEAIERMHAAKAAGADGFFVEAPVSLEQMKQICAEAPRPLVANMIEGGKTPILPQNKMTSLGYQLILYPLTAVYSAAQALKDSLQSLHEHGHSDKQAMLSFAEFNELIGVPPGVSKPATPRR